MDRRTVILIVGLALVAIPPAVRAATCGCGHVSCTGSGDCPECVPACTATWEEKKSTKPKYSIRCEYACTRGFDSWHAPDPECRCRPPCGDVLVKKRLYKADGPETVERVPKYDVHMVPAAPCGCDACRERDEPRWWHPVRMLTGMLAW